MKKMYRAALAGCGLALTVGCTQQIGNEADLGASSEAVTTVTWTSAVGVSTVANDLTKTASTSWSNAGAVSAQTLSGDGYVEFTSAEANTSKMLGLSNGDTDQGYADIDFAIQLAITGGVAVYEGGVFRGYFGTYQAGDLFRIETVGGSVSYKKNGTTFYTSTGTPTFPLLVDTSLKDTGATLNDVVLDVIVPPSFWQNLVGVSAASNGVTKTNALISWNAGASSQTTIASDGYVEFTSSENTTDKMAGLGNGDASASYTDIEYAVYLRASGVFGVYESGTSRGSNMGSYAAGDVFRVEASNGAVTYKKNGVTFYTSSIGPTFPLLADTSLRTPGATINGVALVEAAYWQNVGGVSTSGADLTKTDSTISWNAGASTVASISGDGGCEFTSAENNTDKMAGLSNGDSSKSYTDIDFAVFLRANGAFAVYEAGTSRGNFGTYAPGDIFRVESSGGSVSYLKNGVSFYTSSLSPTAPLRVDTSLRTPGATLNSVTLN